MVDVVRVDLAHQVGDLGNEGGQGLDGCDDVSVLEIPDEPVNGEVELPRQVWVECEELES